MNKLDILFIGDSADFHVVDKYNQACDSLGLDKIYLYSGVSVEKGSDSRNLNCSGMVRRYDFSNFLMGKHNKVSQFTKNILKAALYPLQIILLRRFYNRHVGYVCHSFTMYYIVLCYFCRIRSIATPQGSEILRRLDKSWFYRLLAIKALFYAKTVIVDSVSMRNKLASFSVNSEIYKNGFDAACLLEMATHGEERNAVVSIRTVRDTNRIMDIVVARNEVDPVIPLCLIYPSCDFDYHKALLEKLHPQDSDLGRLGKSDMYNLLVHAKLVISIPVSDSSPRSVYESIFAGSAVALTYSPFLEELPPCMKRRIYVADLDNSSWFSEAVTFANSVTQVRYIPSDEALEMCDQTRTMGRIRRELYRPPV